MGMLHDSIQSACSQVEIGQRALSEPKQFLSEAYNPGQEALLDAIEFHLSLLVIGITIFAFLAAKKKGGDFAQKSNLVLNAVVNLVMTAALALVWHVVYRALGGSASLEGTYCAYVYAAGPYIALSVLATLIVVASLPPHLQHLALSPATAATAFEKAKGHPKTSHVTLFFGLLAVLGVPIVSIVKVLDCYSYVHEISGWKCVLAVVLSLIVGAPVVPLLKRLALLFGDDEQADAEQPSSPAVSPAAVPLVVAPAEARKPKCEVAFDSSHAPFPPLPRPRFVPPPEPRPRPVSAAPIIPPPRTPESVVPKETAPSSGRWVASTLFVVLLVAGLAWLAYSFVSPVAFSQAATQDAPEIIGADAEVRPNEDGDGQTRKALGKEIDQRMRGQEEAARVRELDRIRKALEAARQRAAALEEEKKALAAAIQRDRLAADQRFAGIQLTGRRVVFLVDMSGSMEYVDEKTVAPEKWAAVRDALARIMRSLSDLEKYQVILFADGAASLFGDEGWIDFDRTSVERVTEALSKIRPNGGTNMYAGLEAAFRLRGQGLDTIYLLSDGLPNMGEGLTEEQAKGLKEPEQSAILGKYVRRKLRSDWNDDIRGVGRVRINAVGFYYESPDVGAFLWALARENGGSFVGTNKP
jgi:Mg-chelatase subunit ChlD